MKKILTTLLALLAVSLGEQPQGNYPIPHAVYGPPQKEITIEPIRAQLAANIISSQLTIEQLIRLTEQLSSRQQAVAPGGSYNSPSPQTSYVSPNIPNQKPGVQLRRPVPQTTYGVPNNNQAGASNRPPSTSYGVPDSTATNLEHFDRIKQNQGQNLLPAFPVQNFKGQQKEQYNTIDPILRDIENEKLQNNAAIAGQFLPVKEPSDFRGQNQNNNQYIAPNVAQNRPTSTVIPNRYVPAPTNTGRDRQTDSVDIRQGTVRNLGELGGNNFGKPEGSTRSINAQAPNINNNDQDIDQKYLPPTTTRRTVVRRPTRPTQLPETAELPENSDNEDATEAPNTQDDPNVAVATAVAGGDVFYLQHPDGRLQRVILQKPQQSDDKAQLYSQNLQYQPLQAFPNGFYSPVVAVGWK